MSFGSSAVFQHDAGLVDPALLVEWFKERVGAQAFASSFPAGKLGLVLKAIAPLVFAVGWLRAQVFGFQRGRTRADRLSSCAMSQRANQSLEPMPIAVTAAAFAPAAPSTGMAHL